MASTKERVIQELKKYLASDQWKKLRRKNPKYTQWVESLTDKDISFGANPKFILGKVHANSTGVGESSYGNTKTQRTVSMDHVSSQKCFVDLSNRADKKTLERGHANFYTGSKFYYQKQAFEIAKQDGKVETSCYLSDLNFMPKSSRVNRYHIEYTSNTQSCSLWPILAKKGDKTEFIGFWEEHGKNVDIDLEIAPPIPPLKKLLIFGIIATVVAVGVGLIFLLT